jgi:phage/plasmid-like protein (TIGR03299 family)
MPANVESMFSVREVPWHREGTILADYPGSWEEARIPAGLTWDPITAPVYALTGVNDDGSEHFEPLDNFQSIARSDNGKVLAVLTKKYELITNGEMGEIVEAVLDMPNVKYETAGSLEGGRKVWVLAKLDEPFTIGKDTSPTIPYLAITNHHNGTGGCTLRATAIRVVCANTFRAAELEGERNGLTFTFLHKGSWRDKIEQATQAVTGVRKEIGEYKELMTGLLGIPVSQAQIDLFVNEFIPAPPAGLATDRVLKNIEQSRQAVHSILNSKTVEGTGIEGTAGSLVQASVEYLDHVRTARSWETRTNRTLLRPEPLKAKALSIVREIVHA